MNNIGKISVVKHKSNPQSKSIRQSLTAGNFTRMPNAIVPLTPWKELDNSFRTGLDPDASYILRMDDTEAKAEEIRLVTELRDRAQKMFVGIDLGSRAPFYKDTFKRWKEPDVCSPYHMKDGDNTFNLNEGEQLITFAWLRVHPWVAPSGAALKTGNYSACKYYVNDFDVETQDKYADANKLAKALADLSVIKDSPSRLRQVARQCGVNVSDEDKPENVFNRMFDYINDEKNKRINMRAFEGAVSLGQEALDLRDTIKLCFTYGILHNFKSAVYMGELRYASNEDEIIENLSKIENQGELLNLEQQLKIKKSSIYK